MLLHPLLWGDKVAWRCTTEAFIIGSVPCRLISYFIPLLLLFTTFFFYLPLPQHVAAHPTIHAIIHAVLPHDGTKKSCGNICSLLFDLLEWGNSAASPSSPPSLSHESTAAQILENWPYSVTMCHIWLHFGDNKLRVWENTEWKQDLTLTNTESRSVFMEVQCGRSLNVDDAPSASAPHPEGNTDSISPLAWQPPHLSLV